MPPEAAQQQQQEGGGQQQQQQQAAPWHSKITDAELIGHIQNKGWHEKDAATAAMEAAAAHRKAEKHLGVPADQLLRLPANLSDSEAMKPVYERLGAPKDAKEYDFSTVKMADGSAVEDGFFDVVRAVSARRGLSKDAAADVATAMVRYLETQEAAETADRTAKNQEAMGKINANWGANREANMFVAKQGALALGVTPEEFDAVVKAHPGADRVLEMYRKIGVLNGEHKFVSGDSPASNGVMTREQAVARRAELMADPAWSKRYMEGDQQARRDMLAVNTLISAGR